jgi:hypothetical protein
MAIPDSLLRTHLPPAAQTAFAAADANQITRSHDDKKFTLTLRPGDFLKLSDKDGVIHPFVDSVIISMSPENNPSAELAHTVFMDKLAKFTVFSNAQGEIKTKLGSSHWDYFPNIFDTRNFGEWKGPTKTYEEATDEFIIEILGSSSKM